MRAEGGDEGDTALDILDGHDRHEALVVRDGALDGLEAVPPIALLGNAREPFDISKVGRGLVRLGTKYSFARSFKRWRWRYVVIHKSHH